MQSTAADPALAPADARYALAQACTSLWLATLSLMTAYLQQQAPAHRYLLAQRIARNFDTLQGQECYSDKSRAKFAKLARRWERNAQRLSPHGDTGPGVFTRLQRLFAR